jgi:hypothetical protein
VSTTIQPAPSRAPDRRSSPETASASLYLPDSRRTRAALSIRCPYCAQVHLGRVSPGTDAEGPRRMACGRLAIVVVRRRYGREVA